MSNDPRARVPASDLLLTDAESYFDQVVKERRWTGRKTYQTGLEHRDGRYDWNRMALEEALDLGQYLAAQNRRLEERLTKAREAASLQLTQARELWLEEMAKHDPERVAAWRGYADCSGCDCQTRLPPEWWTVFHFDPDFDPDRPPPPLPWE